jgi:hypothetical protein
MGKNNKKIALAALVLFALLSVVLYQRLGIKNLPSAPQATPVAKPTPSKVLPNSPTKAPSTHSTHSSKQTSSHSATPQIKKTEKPKKFPTSTKSSAKPVTPVKYGNIIPENDVFPFPVVGKQIEPGYYYNVQGSCSIGVFDSKGNDLYDIISKKSEQTIINLKSGDQVQNLCELIKGLPPVYEGSNIPNGMHIINGDLKPGTYTTSNNCSYWVSKGGSASEYTRGISANIEQSFLSNAGVPFTLGNINEAVYFHSGCGVINKVG